MIQFTLKKIKLSVDMGFLAVIAIMTLSSENTYFLVFLSCMLHETGHLTMIFLCKKSVSAVSFNAAGIKIFPCQDRIHSAACEILILLGGPLFNFIAAAVLVCCAGKENIAVYINLLLGIFNLLPFRCLDGGSIIVNALECCCDGRYSGAVMAMRVINVIVCILVCYFFRDFIVCNISAVIMIIYLIFSEILK